MAVSPQVYVRIRADKLAKIDRLAEVSGMRRGTLLRGVLEDFAEVAEELAEVIAEARRGAAAEALTGWAEEVVRRSARETQELRAQLSMPTRGGDVD